ncbi:MAG TPA: hypothetical protein VL693_04815 [Vicinamibacterales bacterium]|jgi:hypothetical protein|nr:hypothetical protein [Vicinamibacterales bacterium]
MRKPIVYLAAAAALLAPLLLLVSDMLLMLFVSEPGLLIQRVALTLFIPALVGVAAFSRGRARWQTAGGAGLAVLGALAIVIRQSFLAAPIRPPAVLLPLGLLVMSGALIGSTVSRRMAALIAAGAILFPLAHQSGVAAALILCDLLFVVSFWSIAKAMVRG